MYGQAADAALAPSRAWPTSGRWPGPRPLRREALEAGARPGGGYRVLTTFDLDESVLSALRAGAGDALLAPSVTRRLLDRFASNLPDPAAARPAALDTLTARELEVLGLLAG